MTSGSQLERRA